MSRNIRTLGDVGGNDSHDSGEDSDGEDRRQEFYVGGSEQSGQQVLGPETGRRDFRESVFNAAREAGAEEYRVEDDKAESSQVGGGMGIRLGRTDNDHVLPSPAPQRPQLIVYHLYFWENGFSLNDGPLRDPNNRADRDFVADVMRGRIPQELVAAHPGVEIDVRLERKNGPYVLPKSKPFEGTGARLGGVVPNVVSNPSPAVPSSSQRPNESEDYLAKAQSDVQLDPNSPKTKLQIRLQDGSRLVGEFNNTNTVASVRNFAVTARPQLAFQEFQLMTTYPPKVIDDETCSLSDAGLLGAVIAIKPVS